MSKLGFASLALRLIENGHRVKRDDVVIFGLRLGLLLLEGGIPEILQAFAEEVGVI